MTAPTQQEAQIPEDILDDEVCLLSAYIEAHPEHGTEDQWRWWIFCREQNGLQSSGAVVKKGRRWFVVPRKFRAWILAGN